VWDDLHDGDALDERLAAGFVTDCRRDGTPGSVSSALIAAPFNRSLGSRTSVRQPARVR
jgi:hypothetical protein